MLDHIVLEDDSIFARRKDIPAIYTRCQRAHFAEMRHCLTIPILGVLSQEPGWHAKDLDSTTIRANDKVLNQIVGCDDFDHVSKAESFLISALNLISDQNISFHLVIFEDSQ